MKSLIPWKLGQKHAVIEPRNNWLDNWWNDPFDNFLPTFTPSLTTQMPTIDVSEDKKEFHVRAEIPGMTEKDIQITWHDGVLRIHGEKKDEKEERKKDRYYKECRYGSFSRDIPIGASIDWNNTQAKYRNGVLTITLPKTGEASKAIEVKIS